LRIWPSWAKALVVSNGFDSKWKPSAVAADHDMVAWLRTNSPENPTAGSSTLERSVTGPLQRMSKEQVAGTEAGLRKRKSAFGILKKSNMGRSLPLIEPFPAPIWISTLSIGRGIVQKRPSG
jgi:hypothetical protein